MNIAPSFTHPRLSLVMTGALVLAGLFAHPGRLFAQQQVTEPPYVSGQALVTQGFIQVALEGETGKTVFILTPDKAPAPTNTSMAAQAPIYLIAYPVQSTIPADHLDCTVTNCKGLNVLPFANSNYGTLAGTSGPCETFNHGKPCSQVEGHDHIVGTPFTGGDFNVAWQKVLVVFTPAGFKNDAYNTRITSVNQLEGLISEGYVKTMDIPSSSFNCNLVPETRYEQGTPVLISYP